MLSEVREGHPPLPPVILHGMTVPNREACGSQGAQDMGIPSTSFGQGKGDLVLWDSHGQSFGGFLDPRHRDTC